MLLYFNFDGTMILILISAHLGTVAATAEHRAKDAATTEARAKAAATTEDRATATATAEDRVAAAATADDRTKATATDLQGTGRQVQLVKKSSFSRNGLQKWTPDGGERTVFFVTFPPLASKWRPRSAHGYPK